MSNIKYNENSIKSLDWKQHIRLRPGMYIGKIGDGSSFDDGIYVLIKEAIDNSIDEYTMGSGKKLKLKIDDNKFSIRDYGRGIPLNKLVDCVSKINTGGKYDSGVFQKSIGLNGVGTKAINALSSYFKIESYRDKKGKIAEFKQGNLINESDIFDSTKKNGTYLEFIPDNEIFVNYKFRDDYIIEQIKNYTYLNRGLTIYYNNHKFISQNGLLDLLKEKADEQSIQYPIIHIDGQDIEFSFTHSAQYGEEYYSYVNGQYTPHGGTHLMAFREAIAKTIRGFYNKEFYAPDIRTSILGALSIRMQEPIFESQTKTKLGSTDISPKGPTIKHFINNFIKTHLNNYLHKNPETADLLLKKIIQSEKERKEINGIKKLANERSKKASIHNKKLKDCKIHFKNKNPRHEESSIFITEGNSASGSITKSRDVQTQAVFSLRGKPLNCYGSVQKIVYENEEFNLLLNALNIEDNIENLRYNKIIIATDADVDGMHIRLLIVTYFLYFFPELVLNGHLYILETPLFRVRNEKKQYIVIQKQKKIMQLTSLKQKLKSQDLKA